MAISLGMNVNQPGPGAGQRRLYQLEHLTRSYGRRIVLAIDHLEIETGRMYACWAPTAPARPPCSYSPFLDEPTTGSLRFCGKAVGSDRVERLALRRQVVLVDQHPIMFSTSVAANIEFGLKIRKIDRAARQRAVQAALETVGLERYRAARATNSPVARPSGWPGRARPGADRAALRRAHRQRGHREPGENRCPAAPHQHRAGHDHRVYQRPAAGSQPGQVLQWCWRTAG